MFCSRHFAAVLIAACVWAAAPTLLPGQDVAPSPQEEVARLVDVLKSSDGPVYDKAMACRRLGVVGDRTAVPALAALLADEQLATYARSALEAIPGPEADDALREAAGRVEGELLIGVLGSIGKRRDAKAIDAVGQRLGHPDHAVAAAAARTLGHIGTPESAEVLQGALSQAAGEFRPAAAVACLICAERLVQQGHRDVALALYDAVRRADLPEHLTLAATHRAMVVQGKAGLPLLVEQLRSGDEARFRFALQAAREVGAAAAAPLIAQFADAPAPRQALLILALRDIGDRTAVPVILKAAGGGAKEVRIRAIHALPAFGDPAAVPVLLAAAVEPDADVARVARAALARLESDEINAAIAAMLDADDPKTLHVAVTLAGQRGIASATPALFKLAGSPDATLRVAAVGSLGSTIQLDDLPRLIALAVAPTTPDGQRVAREALKTACGRLPREASAEKLAAAMAGASTGAKVALLEQIAAVGGRRALETVVAAARGNDDALQDAATRLLGEWMTADAAPALRDLARTLTDGKYKIRALRGYIRIARQLNMTPGQRLEVCRGALAIAERNEEKVLVLETLARVGTPEALALAVSYLDDAALKEPAAGAVVAVAEQILVTSPGKAEEALGRASAVTTDRPLAERAASLLARARELAEQQRQEGEFVALFDGQTTEDWEGDPAVFRVEDGAIVGGNLQKAVGRGNDFLCTKKTYGDFELRLQFKLLGNNANGGVNLRSKRNPPDGVASGYQADLGDNYWGGLYDEARRNRMLAPAAAKPPIRPGDWNDYRIRCEGKRIQLWVNGIQTVDYTEPEASIPLVGILALQVQANRPSEAWYRNIRIRELTP